MQNAKRRPADNYAPAPSRFTPVPYAGTGTEVVDGLTPSRAIELGIHASRLVDVAEWHEARRPRRHGEIAARLRLVAAQLTAGNDNAPQRAAA